MSIVDHLGEATKLRIKRALIRANLEVALGSSYTSLARVLADTQCTTVIDVGANVGQYATLIRRAGYTEAIVSYEPLSDAFRALSQNCAKDRLWSAVNAGLGAKSGRATINVSENSYSSSIRTVLDRHLNEAPDSRVVRTEPIRITTLTEEMDKRRIDPKKTFAKIDTQGYESEVLTGAGTHLDSIRGVQLEMSLTPLYAGQLLFPDLLEIMTAAGLSLWRIDPGFSSRDGRMLQCDGIFIRE